MIRTNKLKVYIEDMSAFRKKLKAELKDIDTGRVKTLRENSINFQSLNQFRKFLTPKRLELLRAIKHNKPKSIYELSKIVKRTPENVNSDIKFLEQLGFVDLTKIKDIRKKVVPEVGYSKMTIEIQI
ncbi:MAG: hypothetical protein AABX29_08415 [Nanoarchaeota archaeon]